MSDRKAFATCLNCSAPLTDGSLHIHPNFKMVRDAMYERFDYKFTITIRCLNCMTLLLSKEESGVQRLTD